MVDLKTAFNSVGIIIGTTIAPAALKETVNKLPLIDLETHHRIELCAAALKKLLKSLGLGYRAWETVKYHSGLSLVSIVVKHIGKDVNHQFIRDEIPLGDIGISDFTKLRAPGDMVSEHFSGRNVKEAIFLDKLVALGAFATAGGSEKYKINHF